MSEPHYIHRLAVPFGHCDIAGIVYTPRFSDYCMEGVEQFLKREIGLDWYAINLAGDYANPVMRLDLQFHQSVVIGDELELFIGVSHIGRSSFTLDISGHKAAGGEGQSAHCFSSTMVLAFVDLRAKTSIPIPKDYLRQLQQCLQPDCAGAI